MPRFARIRVNDARSAEIWGGEVPVRAVRRGRLCAIRGRMGGFLQILVLLVNCTSSAAVSRCPAGVTARRGNRKSLSWAGKDGWRPPSIRDPARLLSVANAKEAFLHQALADVRKLDLK